MMSISPGGCTVFVCKGTSVISALGTSSNPNPVAFAFDCVYDVLAIAALCDAAALVATRTAIWVLFTRNSSGMVLSRTASMQRVAGGFLAGFSWDKPASEAIFAEVSSLAAIPCGTNRWQVVGHDRFARKLFMFALTYDADSSTPWFGGTVTAVAGDGSADAPYGGLMRLESTATPNVVFATAWLGKVKGRECKDRTVYAINVATGKASKLYAAKRPSLLCPALHGDILNATAEKLEIVRNVGAPSAAIRFLCGFWSRARHRNMGAVQHKAVRAVLLACSRRHLPLELQEYILSFVAIDMLGRANRCFLSS